MALGTTLGRSLGGILIAGIGWRAIFLVNLPIGFLSLYLTHRYLRPARSRRNNLSAPVDVRGTLSLGLTLAASRRVLRVGTMLPIANVRTAHEMLVGAPPEPGKVVLRIADPPRVQSSARPGILFFA
jgi:MFS family permease